MAANDPSGALCWSSERNSCFSCSFLLAPFIPSCLCVGVWFFCLFVLAGWFWFCLFVFFQTEIIKSAWNDFIYLTFVSQKNESNHRGEGMLE